MSLEYRPEIERLRALAVLSVITYHFFPSYLPGGFSGVDIFFVISGFLITRIILAGLREGSFSLLDFYRRRIRRIFPALILVISFLLLSGWLLLFTDEYLNVGRHTIASSLFVQNFMLFRESGYFDQSAELKPLLHLWSLSVEEQFYVLWPLLLMFWFRNGFKIQQLIIPLLLASFGINVWMRHNNPAADFYWPLPRFWELLLGAVLVLLPARFRHQDHVWVGRILRFLGIALLGAGFFIIQPHMSFPGFWALLPTTGAALVIASGNNSMGRSPNSMMRAIAYVGRISYPLYLWHWPLLALSHIVGHGAPPLTAKIVLIVVTIGLASLTYHFVEKPVRRDETWKTPGILMLAMMMLVSTGVAILHFEGFPSRSIESRNPNKTNHPIPGFESLASNCSSLGASQRLADHCKIFNPDGQHQTLVLWGDSSAIAWTPVFLNIARLRDARLIVIGHASCPPLLSARKTHFDLPESAHYCQDGQLQWEVLHLIEKVHPDLSILMGALGGYRTDVGVAREDTEFMTDQEGEEANRLSNRETLLRQLPATLDRVSAVSPVLMFRNWPLLPRDLPPPSSPTLRDILARDNQARYYPRAYFDAQRQWIDEILMAHSSVQVDLFDPSIRICDRKQCSNQINGIAAYSDRYHITPKASLTYMDTLKDLIDRRIGP